RELTINDPGGSTEEGHWNEYCRQHRGNTKQSDGNLSHRFFSCRHRIQMLFHHDPFYVLDYNNRIIDQKTDRQYHGKHGEGVDREAKNVNDRKGAQYHDWNGHGWNDRGTPVLQEQEHDQEHQDNRFDQRFDYAL